MQGLVGCPKCQAVACCLDKVERLWLVSAMEFVDELILCVTALACGCCNVRDVVAGLEVLTFGTDFQNSSSTIVSNNVEPFRCKLVVI